MATVAQSTGRYAAGGGATHAAVLLSGALADGPRVLAEVSSWRVSGQAIQLRFHFFPFFLFSKQILRGGGGGGGQVFISSLGSGGNIWYS